jgi:hypothetical protein
MSNSGINQVVGYNIPYLGKTIYGTSADDVIYVEGENLYSGNVGYNTIYGGGGSNTIYGDAYGLYGTVNAGSNIIYADGLSRTYDGSAISTIYGNAYVMGGSAQARGNTIYDANGASSYLYGNAHLMTDQAVGGHNHI